MPPLMVEVLVTHSFSSAAPRDKMKGLPAFRCPAGIVRANVSHSAGHSEKQRQVEPAGRRRGVKLFVARLDSFEAGALHLLGRPLPWLPIAHRVSVCVCKQRTSGRAVIGVGGDPPARHCPLHSTLVSPSSPAHRCRSQMLRADSLAQTLALRSS